MELKRCNLKPILICCRRYIAEHKRLTLDREPNYDFLGHPFNAYTFVRHVGNNWLKIRNSIAHIDRNETSEFGKLRQFNSFY